MALHLLGGAGSSEAQSLPTAWAQESQLLSCSGSSLLVEVSFTYFSADITHSDFLTLHGCWTHETLLEAFKRRTARWAVGTWRGRDRQWPPFLRWAAVVCATPWLVSWLQREASGSAWVTSGPGLSHRQQPGCPATGKGTKETFDVQRPSSGHAVHTELQEGGHSCGLPTPSTLPTSGSAPDSFTKAS
jgi:hypothetical protein